MASSVVLWKGAGVFALFAWQGFPKRALNNFSNTHPFPPPYPLVTRLGKEDGQNGSFVNGSRWDGYGRWPVFHERKTSRQSHTWFFLSDQYQMLFTWSTHNLCIVFRQWRITGTSSLVLSLAAIVLLSAGYEGVREISRQYEQSHATKMSAFSSSTSSMSPFNSSKPHYACIKLKRSRRSCPTK